MPNLVNCRRSNRRQTKLAPCVCVCSYKQCNGKRHHHSRFVVYCFGAIRPQPATRVSVQRLKCPKSAIYSSSSTTTPNQSKKRKGNKTQQPENKIVQKYSDWQQREREREGKPVLPAKETEYPLIEFLICDGNVNCWLLLIVRFN